jgi:Brp/Blh family beta-carotene 15,15'-monooxygenase
LIFSFSEKQKICITLICIVLGVFVPSSILWIIAGVHVLTIGVIHGANDLYIATKTVNTVKKWSFKSFFGIYILFVLLMVFGLYKLPLWALLLFVLVSAFHFGEQQWHLSSYISSLKLNLFYFAYGLFLFALLFYLHTDQTITIISDIAGIQLSNSIFFILIICSGVAALIFLGWNINQLKHQLLVQCIALALFLVLFSTTSLLWSFSVYFVLWHSIPSLSEQAQVLYPHVDRPIATFVRMAFPYWLLAMIGFGLAIYFFSENTSSLVSLFFAFLAAITIPHVAVIFWMHQKK